MLQIRIPTDLYHKVFEPMLAYNSTRICCNSWGAPAQQTPSAPPYDEYSRSSDLFMWDHPDFLLLYGGGNWGRDGPMTLAIPARCKNAIAVGSSTSFASSFLDNGVHPTVVLKPIDSSLAESHPVMSIKEWDKCPSITSLDSKERVIQLASPPDACAPLTNDLTAGETIVLVDASVWDTCSIAQRILAAQTAGAVAVVVVSKQEIPRHSQTMQDDDSVSIPVGTTKLWYQTCLVLIV